MFPEEETDRGSHVFYFRTTAYIASHRFALEEQEGPAAAGGGGEEAGDLSRGGRSRYPRRGVMKWTSGEINAADLPNLVSRQV